MEFEKARLLMVKRQLMGRDITDPRVLAAMRNVPRHLFVQHAHRDRAYDDMAMGIGEGQTISQPYMVAKMTEMLEIGTGSGYQSAVLAALAREVCTVERIEELSLHARQAIESNGIKNVRFLVSDGTGGWPEEAPFDRILVTAASPDIPAPLARQLAEGGILIAPVGSQSSQQLVIVRKVEGELRQELGIFCVFVPLIGAHGFDE